MIAIPVKNAVPLRGSRTEDLGEYTLWVDNGFEGWAAYSFETLNEALGAAASFGRELTIMRQVFVEERET